VVSNMLLFWCSWFKSRYIKLDLSTVGKFCFHFSHVLRQVYFAGCRVQGAGWNLIITGKPLTLKIINNLYTHQGFLHKVVRLFHIVKTRLIHYKYLSIDTLRPVKSLQSHLDGRSTDVSINSRFGSGLPSTTEDCYHKWSK